MKKIDVQNRLLLGLVALIGCAMSSLAQPLFPHSDTLNDVYGVCTHVSRPKWDYEIRDRELELTQSVGISWIRSDLDFGNYFGSLEDEDPVVFDNVMNSCEQHNQQWLGILTWLGKYPWDDSQYGEYVKKLAQHYNSRIQYWEALNEVNLFPHTENLTEKYMQTLKTTYQALKNVNPKNQVLSSGFAGVPREMLEELCQMGAQNYWDIFNFHSYSTPEELVGYMQLIDTIMTKYNWRKPVWLTECGMHTAKPKNSSVGFYHELLPKALRRLNIREEKVTVGILRDEETQYNVMTDNEVETLLRPYAGKIQPVNFAQLKAISVKKLPVLMATKGESFPARMFPVLVDYVRRGGSIILGGGMPFYYDNRNDTEADLHRREMGTRLYKQLHMSSHNVWEDKKTGEKLTENPTIVRRCADADFNYQWEFKDSPARYLSDDNLAAGDTLISLITAGTENNQGTVVGIYRLNSDLHGNIVFQTRLYASTLEDREPEQACRVARIYLIALAYGVERVFWYNLRSKDNDPTYSEDCFGLIHADFQEKPAMQAYRTLVQQMPEGSTRPRLETQGNIWKCTWTRPDGQQVMALWAPQFDAEYRLPGNVSRIIDHLGNEVKSKKGKITLNEGVKYIYYK